MDDYWTFIFGLQYNANLFFNDQIEYYQIEHEWSSLLCNVFLVRDYEKNTLLYDSIDGLVIGLFQRNFKSCSLYPFELLFDEKELEQHCHFNFEIYNYPIVVFKDQSLKYFALVQVKEKIKSQKIQPIGDPREFCGVRSSQFRSENKIFTLISLNQSQKSKVQDFDKNLDWMNYFNQIKINFLENRFNYINDSRLILSNNLFINYHGKKRLIQKEDNLNNLAFSLLQRCLEINERLSDLNANYHERPPYPDFIDSCRDQYSDFLNQFQTETINLICHTANDYKNAWTKTKFLPIQKNSSMASDLENIPNFDETNADSTDIEVQPIENNETPINGVRAITTLIILFIVIFLLVYGLLWVIRQYELAKVTAITFGVMVFLYIWSKK